MKTEKIDRASWGRREICAFFSRASNPFYAVTFRQDVTALYDYVKKNGLSFYYAMTWAVTRAINDTEAFHYFSRGGELFRLEERIPSFTDLRRGEENFHIVTMPCGEDVKTFCAEARRQSMAQDCFIRMEAEGEDLIYVSCLPWVDLTALTNERDWSDPVKTAEDAIPHVTWGKYVEENGRKTLGISLEVNHRFIDGVHIGQFAENLTKRLAGLE